MPVFSSPDQMSNAKRNEIRNCLNFELANKSKKKIAQLARLAQIKVDQTIKRREMRTC